MFDKASVQSAPRRPLRIFDAFQLRSISGREVSEVLSKKEFFYACSAILPSISEYEVDEMFNEACELIRKRSLRACVEEGGWREVLLENGRKVHVNINMKRAQWRAPYTEHSYFDSSGVDIETFVAVVLQQNLLMRGYFHPFLYQWCAYLTFIYPVRRPYASFINAMRPEDFWPHAATHLKQKLEAESAE